MSRKNPGIPAAGAERIPGMRSLGTLNFKLSYNRIFGRHNVSGMMFYDQYEYNQSIVLPYRYQTVGGWFAYKYNRAAHLAVCLLWGRLPD